MTRSAKQRATRNLKRKLRPVFEFTKLSADVQFLILCRCDLTSIARLISISSSARKLYLKYPETTIQNALETIPQPMANLLHVSSTLENIGDDDFDADEIVERLKQTSLDQWPTSYPQLFTVREDALGRMQSLVDIYAEVKVAADIVAQAMKAATEAFVDRLVVVTRIVLSAEEQMRMLCALLVVRIYYQLRFKFQDADCERGRNLSTAFMRRLAPWQMAQGSSIEAFIRLCVRDTCDAWDEMIDKRYTCRECVSQKSSYLRDYIQFTVMDIESGYRTGYRYHTGRGSNVLRYSDAVRAEEERRRRRSWAGHVSEVECPGWRQASQLCNYGWTMCNPISPGNMMLKRVVLRCGILFWDQSRLVDWGVADWGTVVDMGRCIGKLYQSHGYLARKECEEERRSRQIVDWTRSYVQISFEGFLANQEGQ